MVAMGITRLKRTAYHEAGHTVLGAAINDMPELVSIRAEGAALGRTRHQMCASPSILVQVHMAGFAAEEVLTGRRPRRLQKGLSRSITAALHKYPLLLQQVENDDEYMAAVAVIEQGCASTLADVQQDIIRYYVIAKESLETVWKCVDAVAKALLKHEELDRRSIAAIVAAAGDIYLPVDKVQCRHGLLR